MAKPFPELGILVKNIPVPRKGQKSVVNSKKIARIYNKIALVRGVVIEGALHIEGVLTSTLLHYLAGKQYKLHAKLREHVFDAEFCTFMQKRKMLSKIFEEHGDKIKCLSKTEAKAMRKEINDIIMTRDKFAHGDMFIDCKDFSTSIKYYSGGTREDKVVPSDAEAFTKKCASVKEQLRTLNSFFRDEYDA